MLIQKISLYYHTLRYLKWTQIRYRIYYVLRRKWRSWIKFSHKSKKLPTTHETLSLVPSLPAAAGVTYKKRAFTFLNLSYQFGKKIDWNEARHAKLWTYNLTYFEYLHLPNLKKAEGLSLIKDFADHIEDIEDGLEPFPISLRVINWIKFLTYHRIQDRSIDQSLYDQLLRLVDQLEYHLLGNHLLENGFSLLFGAYYFQDEKLYKQAKKILIPELDEQILSDGAHFELSPMYHQLMLHRLLDCYNLVKNNDYFSQELMSLLKRKATAMLGWLENMTFSDGSIPLLNDSAKNIAVETKQLIAYAERLGLTPDSLTLKQSGYRKINHEKYEIVFDVGNISPDYIPGHSHSDTFSFELYVKGSPFIVDTGISTYNKNDRRQLERSTAAHNTVKIEDQEQTAVWGGFRVGKRAKIVHLQEEKNVVLARHNGYSNLGVLHERKFVFEENVITIIDKLIGNKKVQGTVFMHFHPSVDVNFRSDYVETPSANVTFASPKNSKLNKASYLYAPMYNHLVNSTKLSIDFTEEIKTTIIL